jgi:excisionase family DNA binding protein
MITERTNLGRTAGAHSIPRNGLREASVGGGLGHPAHAAAGAETLSGALKVGDVAALLRCHPSTVYRMLRRRELRAFKLGSDWRFLRADLEDWMRRAAELNAGGLGAQ